VPTAHLESVEIFYETHGDPEGVPLLLIIGIGNQLTTWPDEFCQSLVDREFFVIRFDHRDTGFSTRFDDAAYDIAADLEMVATGQPGNPPYSLSEMAGDCVGLLDHLGIDRTHLLGLSMGGMVAQLMAIEHTDRVLSLTSMSSHTGASDAGQPSEEALAALLEPAPDDRQARIEQSVRARQIWATPEHFDENLTREHFTRSWARGGDSSGGTGRHAGAVLSAASRDADLAELGIPTLVIHGDQDQLVDSSGGTRTAEVIPGAELLILEGLGHDLPPPYWAPVIEAITALAVRAAQPSQGNGA
jgi:pimeloyl-ACP methyl ester carboxylesterase